MTITEKPQQQYKVIGTRPIRHDGLEKVTGRAVYGADVKFPGLLWGAVLRSPHAHARIKKLDVSKAAKMPGVFAVMTGADLVDLESKLVDMGEEIDNLAYTTKKLMADDKVVYKGHPVAAVAAVDLNTAQEALKLIAVAYEPLPVVLTVEEAMAPGAPLVLDDLVGEHLTGEARNTNIAKHTRYEFGDTAKGFARAAVTVERTFKLTMVHQGYIEPQNATAQWNQDGKLTVWTSTQGAFNVRDAVASILKMPESNIRVIPLEIGGGFGGKIPIYLEPVAAVLARKAGRPVKLVMDRKSVFEATGPTPGGTIRVKVGADSAGNITAAEADLRYEAGAYPGSPVGAGAQCIFAPYRLPNSRIDAYDVVVNKPKTAAYRAPGATQAAFAMESVVDEVAERLGIDPLEFRLRNASREGDRRADGPIFPRIGNVQVLQAAKRSAQWNAPLGAPSAPHKKRGRGVANGFWFNGGMKSSCNLAVNKDGTVAMVEGSVDIGGTRASIAMQAAEVLGIPAEDVHPTVGDTDTVGQTDVTGGSRTTFATGYAAYLAATNVVKQMMGRAAKLWEIDESGIEFKDGTFFSKSDPELRLTFKQVAEKLDETGGPLSATGTVNMRGAGGAFSTQIADVEVDTETGKVDVLRWTVVQDVGKAIHPAYVEGQMQGGAAQGIGWALNEEYFWDDKGNMHNSSFLDYRMPTALDLPKIETVLVEVPNPNHPYGVRGVGEAPIVAPVAAIANALRDALGTRFTETPMKPSRVLAAIKGGTLDGAATAASSNGASRRGRR